MVELFEQLNFLHDRTEFLLTLGDQTLASNLTLHPGIDGKKDGRESTPVWDIRSRHYPDQTGASIPSEGVWKQMEVANTLACRQLPGTSTGTCGLPVVQGIETRIERQTFAKRIERHAHRQKLHDVSGGWYQGGKKVKTDFVTEEFGARRRA